MKTINLSGRIALVTGASRGIGAAVAKAYAAAGAHVILLARTIGGLEEVDDAIRSEGGQATLLPQDLADLAALDALGPALAEKFGGLDILVGNAATLGTLGPLAHTKADEWQKVMDVNVNANFRLIRTLDPLLQASDAGRALFVTSGAASGLAYWGAYAASKAALETIARTYAAETRKTNIRVNLIDPGIVRTHMRAKAFPGEDRLKLPKPEAVTGKFLALADPGCTYHGAVVKAA